MQNKPAVSRSKLSVPQPQEVDRFVWSGARCWKVIISYKTEVYITEDEKEYFLNQLSAGKKIIRVGEIILTDKFLAITKVR